MFASSLDRSRVATKKSSSTATHWGDLDMEDVHGAEYGGGFEIPVRKGHKKSDSAIQGKQQMSRLGGTKKIWTYYFMRKM